MNAPIFSFVLAIVVSINIAIAQNATVSGTITGAESGEPLPGANIVEKGTTNGVSSNIDGTYSLMVPINATLVISFVGYETTEVEVADRSVIDIVMENAELSEVIVVGTRTAPRSSTDTPLPVDVLSGEDLTSTGQNSFDKALQYKIPSFNTVQTPVNDATSLLDPYEIRNMGPSRTLILINGKRKNMSSLLYVQTSPGVGETGSDISAIPVDAIKRIEVLRDGASAQYGSDAIAGVINVVLKDNTQGGSAILRSGITGQGDGFMIGLSTNGGVPIGKGKGFINYTADFSKIELANRPGTVSAEGEAHDEGADLAVVRSFLERHPDAGNINGSPATMAAKFLINGGVDVTSSAELYFNAAYVYKKVNSFANYRTPYWQTLSKYPYLSTLFPAPNAPGGYDGYLPTFDGDLSDYNGTLGLKATQNGWNYDVSVTVGGNRQTYRVRNSHNGNPVLSPATWIDRNNNGIVDSGEMAQSDTLYRENSPIAFDPGGTEFSHLVGNVDISKTIIISLNVNNVFNILPEWEFVAENAAGQSIIDDQTITATGLTALQNQSNEITFNQRYSQMTYDGYHFSQLGILFNLAVSYHF